MCTLTLLMGVVCWDQSVYREGRETRGKTLGLGFTIKVLITHLSKG